ncbi:hypothetical protein OFR22_11830 [Brachyspira hyodysenteriae]|uniref:hypothetical protein n=1 Tax=Brachyspira hyodysenteriae TaxID=159 RepID=UPI0022CD6CB7|nr:hypothetical protein [Brachyspira hyodysenteriae]MCZ9840364.1 hypothetical protein [Brachyspira hyodysenteriae]MCZ9848752.1 hypothetical protein [Brachyspira hyodysenteriae]MCZ9850507.1 hypothetical protein [Brachyspira hyodysenteriae]MCZ9860741.1 hypothetical protein [Brachyspira hyodysenteriae]MCZ9869759.1 hypothetical protein [Brachyspira hyodysenteriae]
MSSKTIEFYKIFKYCIPSNKEIAKKEEEILENIINMSTKDITAYMRQYIIKLTYYRKNFLDVETANLICKILLEINFVLRIQYLDYLKDKENNTLKNDDYDVNNLSKILQLLISEIAVIISTKEYETNNMFNDSYILKSDTTIGHSIRVFIMIIEATNFFNKKLNQGAANKMRIDFKKTYYKYSERIYQRYNLINSVNTLDSNVKLGVRKIENNTIVETAIGVLMHDISLDKEKDYVPIQNEEKDNHSIKDYGFAKYFMRGNEGVALTVSLHHEYYSHGYGLFTELYKAVLRRNPNHKIEYIVSYDYKDILTLQSLTYLPAKMLEVIDVYDTLTESMNKSPKEAISFMTENFLEKEIMLDPIITDIFIEYLRNIKRIRI